MLEENNNLTSNQVANQGQPNIAANTISEEAAPGPNQQQTFGKSELLDASKILKEILGLTIGNTVADLGAGGGMFTINAARIVSDQGQIYAVDILRQTLSEIESKARMSGLYNVKTIWSNLEIVGAAKIPEASLDFALLVNVLFQSKKHFEVLSEATRLLKPGGKLLVIDWSNTGPGFAPSSELQVDKTKLLDYANQLELSLVQEFKAGEYHFGIVLQKA